MDPSLSHPSRCSRARWPTKCQKQGWASRLLEGSHKTRNAGSLEKLAKLSRPFRKRKPSSHDDRGVLLVFSSCGASVRFLTRCDGKLRGEGESGAEASQAPGTSPTLPQPAPSRARTLEAGESPGESGLISRGSKGLHSLLEPRQVSLGAH